MKRVVGISDLAVSRAPDETLITYALGSCIGVALYDPETRVTGLLHAMLPSPRGNDPRADQAPATFVDRGIQKLFQEAYARGAVKERLAVYVAGGAALQDRDDDAFKIGKRNVAMVRKLFWKNHVPVVAAVVGGGEARTLWIEVETGRAFLRGSEGVVALEKGAGSWR